MADTPPQSDPTARAVAEFLGKLPPGDPEFAAEARGFVGQLLTAAKDPVFLVLRMHLLTEAYLERLIRLGLVRGDRIIDDCRLNYHQKLMLVHSFDHLDDRIVQCLKKLNRLRNRCAHEVDVKITMSDVEAFGQPLGRLMVQARRESKGNLERFLAHLLGLMVGVLVEVVVSGESHLADAVDQADGTTAASS